eukprot:CAMPEP_0118995314 /NCGR_PEP_ID=MMETSP1173-20130426/58275_1 /TAXON_ID=1034831 /ORGANISM="Rhizochromulina marina cf, Strain CCMP1243" /LENGTH=281 /DNA_ID=CAMNT_0006946651 /DNA_START=7 /DNA_END=849 /DNA_ORIENTATION=-
MIRDLLFSPMASTGWAVSLLAAVAILLGDAVLSALIIWKVPYTEIDWVAYMQEVAGYLGGTTDYSQLRGDTGPLVYPAGFVYVYSGLYYATDQGENIARAQWIFYGVYLAVLFIVMMIYRRSCKGPPVILALLVMSKRIHSIFVLRLFNDCIAVLLLYAAVYLFCQLRWRMGCVLYSLAVSIKMNILLFAPGLLLLLLQGNSIAETALCLFICGSIQLALGLPFLTTYPLEYLKGAFDLGRVFMFKWTVNWKFLSPEVFVSKELALCLLAATIFTWVAFFF